MPFAWCTSSSAWEKPETMPETVAHGVMVIVLAIIASQKAKAKDARDAAAASESDKPGG